MKLRIQDNSLRLRLTRKEVAALRDRGFVDSAIHFPKGRAFCYSLESSPDAARVSVDYEGDSLRVVLPMTMATRWADGDATAVEGSDSGVSILVEKDFQCLHKPADRDPDAYPNPLAAEVE
jgi:hypothetical protein